jgi:hypothetical protein
MCVGVGVGVGCEYVSGLLSDKCNAASTTGSYTSSNSSVSRTVQQWAGVQFSHAADNFSPRGRLSRRDHQLHADGERVDFQCLCQLGVLGNERCVLAKPLESTTAMAKIAVMMRMMTNAQTDTG